MLFYIDGLWEILLLRVFLYVYYITHISEVWSSFRPFFRPLLSKRMRWPLVQIFGWRWRVAGAVCQLQAGPVSTQPCLLSTFYFLLSTVYFLPSTFQLIYSFVAKAYSADFEAVTFSLSCSWSAFWPFYHISFESGYFKLSWYWKKMLSLRNSHKGFLNNSHKISQFFLLSTESKSDCAFR